MFFSFFFFFSSRRRHTRWTGDWSSDVCSSDLVRFARAVESRAGGDCEHANEFSAKQEPVQDRASVIALHRSVVTAGAVKVAGDFDFLAPADIMRKQPYLARVFHAKLVHHSDVVITEVKRNSGKASNDGANERIAAVAGSHCQDVHARHGQSAHR